MIAEPTVVQTFTTKRGHRVQVVCRPDTTDAMTADACITYDEYGLAEREWSGVACDVGAHIGGATLALLADNPNLSIIAIEALPANADLISESLALNGWEDRCKVLNAGATCDIENDVTVAYGQGADAFEMSHRFIGGAIWQDGSGPGGKRVTVPPVALRSVVGGNGPLCLVKIDCEGCEWSFLDDPAVKDVEELRGEGHPRDGKRLTHIRGLLEATHVVTLDDTLDFGPFRAVRRG